MNDKMGGDLNKIKVVGKYLIEVRKAAVELIQCRSYCGGKNTRIPHNATSTSESFYHS